KNIDLLDPVSGSKKLVELCSLFSSLNRYIAEAESKYKERLKEARETGKSAADARITAEATNEYKLWIGAKYEKEALLELIRSLKYFNKAVSEDILNQRNI
ncbi:MAG: hypothetical protein AABY22_02765, partial [Nanoarchaeota archaeon]